MLSTFLPLAYSCHIAPYHFARWSQVLQRHDYVALSVVRLNHRPWFTYRHAHPKDFSYYTFPAKLRVAIADNSHVILDHEWRHLKFAHRSFSFPPLQGGTA